MKDDGDLKSSDRFTLRVWRGGNVAWWTLFAFAYSAFLQVAARSAAELNGLDGMASCCGLGMLAMSAAATLVPASLLAGFAVGSLIGGRVRRWPGWCSALASAGYVTLAALKIDSAFWSFPRKALVVGLASLALPIAVWWSRRKWRDRPRALRGS